MTVSMVVRELNPQQVEDMIGTLCARADLVREARQWNRELMGETWRKSGELAASHCERVGYTLLTSEFSQALGEPMFTDAVIAGILHDVLEDTVNPEAVNVYAGRCQQIKERYGTEVFLLVKAVSVDQRMTPKEQFKRFKKRARQYSVSACLIKQADLEDNWETRHVYEEGYRGLWEAYAREMLDEIIPARLAVHDWPAMLERVSRSA